MLFEEGEVDILRDQFWNGIAAIAAIVTIVIEVSLQRSKMQSLALRVFLALICALGGIAVLAVGPLLQAFVFKALTSGIPSAVSLLDNAFANRAPAVVASGVLFGLFPGTVTAMAALSGRNLSQRKKRAIVASIASLVVADTLDYIVSGSQNPSFGHYVFAIVSNFIGGAIAGYLVGLYVEFIVNVIDVRE